MASKLSQKITVRQHCIEIPSPNINVKAYQGPKSEQGKRGDIKGWSASSRRRLRQFLARFGGPQGSSLWGVCLTIPGELLTPDDKGGAELRKIFKRFRNYLERSKIPAVWRLEVQQRGQPHFHLVAWSSNPEFDTWARDTWLKCLKDRGKVNGAKDHACKCELIENSCGSALRYLFDHSSKSKQAQVAYGWGRHWGAVYRSGFVPYPQTCIRLTVDQEKIFKRVLRKVERRRVIDHRAVGGINWASLSIVEHPAGVNVLWLGGSCLVKGWYGVGLPTVAQRRVICRALGACRKNIWAMRLTRFRRSFEGQHFGNFGACLDRLFAVQQRASFRDYSKRSS